jgi:transcriptional regulator NrdR family protein
MKCPACGNDDSNVTRTTKGDVEGDPCIIRERRCSSKTCGHKWKTFETYDGVGGDRAFDQGEIASIVQRANDWLRAPANHVPIVRDVRELLSKATALLANKD